MRLVASAPVGVILAEAAFDQLGEPPETVMVGHGVVDPGDRGCGRRDPYRVG